MAERRKSYMARIDEEMKKLIEQTKREIAQGWKINPSTIETPSITSQIAEWAKIGKALSSNKKKKKKEIRFDKFADFMDTITGVK